MRRIRQQARYENSVNTDALLNSINNADSIEVLKFIGEAVRLHKIVAKEYTNNESLMAKIRLAWKSRMEFLTKEAANANQQGQLGSPLDQRTQGERNSRGSDGGRSDRRGAVLPGRMDQQEAGRDALPFDQIQESGEQISGHYDSDDI